MACDVFVSYAHIDDQPYDGRGGFVSRLIEAFRVPAEQNYGKKLNIYWDKDLASGTSWNPAIYDELASCRIFLAVISPSWQNSQWAGKEWDAVWTRLTKEECRGRQTCIIPVSYTLNKGFKSSLPDQVKSLQICREFKRRMSDDEFTEQVEGLAEDIANVLLRLDKCEPVDEQLPFKAKVFLGQAFSTEMTTWREKLRKELELRGHGVHEVKLLDTWNGQKMSIAIEAEIKQCSAAVHFLEKQPGPYTGENRTAVQIQCDVAKRQGGDNFNLYWIGEVKHVEPAEYPAFVKGLNYSNTGFEDLKASLLTRLYQLDHPVPAMPVPIKPQIWLICESGDRDTASRIAAFFANEKGWHALVPGVNVRQSNVSDDFVKVFREEQYFLFYWGKGGKDWVRNNYDDLRIARAIGNQIRDPQAALMVLGQEERKYKENFPWPWLRTIQYNGFDPNAKEFQEFIRQVETSWGSN